MVSVGEERMMDFISIDYFKKLDLRVGEIVSAEPVKGSDKLMRLEVDLGSERRVILSGIRPDYSAEEVMGLQAVVLCNLEPRRIMGTVSQGMVLDAGYLDGVEKPPFLTVSHRVPNGVRVA